VLPREHPAVAVRHINTAPNSLEMVLPSKNAILLRTPLDWQESIARVGVRGGVITAEFTPSSD
jgi:hypothetical protein